jgi:uncharacterized protein (TIGR03084 family)
MMDVADIARDLGAEQHALDEVVAGLSDHEWSAPTPSPRWSVSHQIAHLLFFDRAAALAIEDPAGFADARAEHVAGMAGGMEAFESATLDPLIVDGPATLLDRWREGRRALAEAAATLSNESRVEWYGPSMSGRSFLTARLMECWAHGQDVVDAVGGERPPTDRLRHVAQLGFITRGWSYRNRGATPPEGDVRVDLLAPSGEVWTFGPAEAPVVVSGDAEQFCLVVTQRRHVDDTALDVDGVGREWLLWAQAFAGPPTDGPPAGGRSG